MARIQVLQLLDDAPAYDLCREDGRLERLCTHGIGHPVGHLRGYFVGWEGIHGCDGCCHDYPTMPYFRTKEDANARTTR